MTARVILFEGPDGAGKTFASQAEFAHEPAAEYVHNGPPNRLATGGELYREYLRQLKAAVFNRDELGRSTIIDRSWPSEALYGPLHRGKSKLTRRHIAKLERFATRHDVQRVGLLANPQLRRARLEARGETWDFAQSVLGKLYLQYFQSHGWIIAGGLPAQQ